MKETKQLKIEKSVHRKLKQIAFDEDMKIGDLATKYLLEGIRREK